MVRPINVVIYLLLERQPGWLRTEITRTACCIFTSLSAMYENPVKIDNTALPRTHPQEETHMTSHQEDLDCSIINHMKAHSIVGLAGCRLQDGKIVWANGYGWADIAGRRPMTPDVIQNIASISKTFTCTAVMQLWEQGHFQLDDPVNQFLPFEFHHPHHNIQTTFRHLLMHTNAIQEGPAYWASYACGDPLVSLGDWLEGYLLPGGRWYDLDQNFLAYEPGQGWNYSSIAFGLLGYLVELLTGQPFHQYCQENIFQPLGMRQSGWLLNEIDPANHAVPYILPDQAVKWRSLVAGQPDTASTEPIPLQLYSFWNYPDGLVRTSARELAQYAAAFTAPDKHNAPLQEQTIRRCFTQEWPPQGLAGDALPTGSPQDGRIIGLTWQGRIHAPTGMRTWGHDGSDPGVTTRLSVRPQDGAGIVILTNSNHSRESMDALSEMLWEYEPVRDSRVES